MDGGEDFEPTAQDVIYLTPVADAVKGHAVTMEVQSGELHLEGSPGDRRGGPSEEKMTILMHLGDDYARRRPWRFKVEVTAPNL